MQAQSPSQNRSTSHTHYRSDSECVSYLNSRLVRISPQNAYLLGIIPKLNPFGSFVKELKFRFNLE